VRGRRPGDRVQSGGHARKLQDVLVDAKVPREARDGLPVACDRAGVAFWVAGVPLRPDPPSPGSVWIWAKPAAEASEEAGPSL
jgi:tRNA(Ile)-lysidine synthase